MKWNNVISRWDFKYGNEWRDKQYYQTYYRLSGGLCIHDRCKRIHFWFRNFVYNNDALTTVNFFSLVFLTNEVHSHQMFVKRIFDTPEINENAYNMCLVFFTINRQRQVIHTIMSYVSVVLIRGAILYEILLYYGVHWSDECSRRLRSDVTRTQPAGLCTEIRRVYIIYVYYGLYNRDCQTADCWRFKSLRSCLFL